MYYILGNVCSMQLRSDNVQAKPVHYQRLFWGICARGAHGQNLGWQWAVKMGGRVQQHSTFHLGHAPLENFDFTVLTPEKDKIA